MTVIRFHFDYVSPNADLAWTQLPRIAAADGAALEPVPVLFAGLLEAHGQLGPAEVPPKRVLFEGAWARGLHLAGNDPLDGGAWQRWIEAWPQAAAMRTRRS